MPSRTFPQRIGDAFRVLAGKALPHMTFSGYGGANFNTAGGMYGRWWRLLLPGARFDYEALANDTWRSAVVSICLAWIADNFPEPRIRVMRYDGTEEKPVPNHEFLSLMRRPNSGAYNSDALWQAVVLSYMTDGNAYLLKERSRAGLPVNLWYVPHWMVYPQWPQDGSKFIDHYVYIVDGKKIKIPREDIIHFRMGIDPYNTRVGLTPIRHVLREICADNDASGYVAALMKNFGVPGVIISPAQMGDVISDDDIDDIKDQWRQQTTGDERGSAIVAPTGVRFDKVAFSPKEMAIHQLVVGAEARICAAMKMPPMLVGLLSGKDTRTHSNYAEARRAGYDDCLIPLQKALAKQMTEQLPELFADDERMDWDYRGVQALQDDQDEIADRAIKLATASQITRAQVKTMMGLEVDADGNDDVYYVPAGVTFIKREKFNELLLTGSLNPQVTGEQDGSTGSGATGDGKPKPAAGDGNEKPKPKPAEKALDVEGQPPAIQPSATDAVPPAEPSPALP